MNKFKGVIFRAAEMMIRYFGSGKKGKGFLHKVAEHAPAFLQVFIKFYKDFNRN